MNIKKNHPCAISLRDHIEMHCDGSRSNFARIEGVRRQQVTEWLAKDMFVIDGQLHSYRRTLKSAKKKKGKI